MRSYQPDVRIRPEVQQYLQASLGEERLQEALKLMSAPPLQCCMRVNLLRCTREQALQDLQHELAPADAKAMGGAQPYAHPDLPQVICIPGSGPNPVNCRHGGVAATLPSSQRCACTCAMRRSAHVSLYAAIVRNVAGCAQRSAVTCAGGAQG